MDIFKGIDFNDSFVLGWSSNDTEITFKIEASIWHDSPHYLSPKPDEYTCYRKCEIQFTGFTSYSGLAEQSSVKSIKDINGSFDYGNIDSLIKTNQGFKVIGEFGNLEIINGKVQLKIYT
ncbi:hypothetical protein [Shewanella japonica]|uniref:hypothetical protein n=1 Tax=Shewanella japonica TaxID=93973 RepID=UPI000E73D128|nr:hypothetical protein [Shewanella japonica]